MFRIAGVAFVTLACAAGAVEGASKKADGPKARESVFTLGRVQAELRAGLSQAEVVERLGSPNILTRDAQGREAWVYDRVSSESEVSRSGAGIGGFGSGAGDTLGGALGISAGRSSAKTRTSQRTLTVVVRFSLAGAVESFSWHDSRF